MYLPKLTIFLILFVFILSALKSQGLTEPEGDESTDPISLALWDQVQALNKQHRYYETFPLLDSLEKHAFAIGDQQYMAWSLEAKGMLYYYQGKLDKAEPLLKRAIEVFKNNGKWHATSMLYCGLSNIRQQKGDFDGAFEYSRKAQSLIPLAISNDPLITTSNDLAVLFSQIGQVDSAYYYQKIVIDSLPQKDSIRLSRAYVNMANIFSSIYNYERADLYMEQALGLVNEERYGITKATTRLSKADLLINQSKFEIAKEYIQKAIDYFESVENKNHLIKAYSAMSALLIAQNKIDQAEAYLNRVTGIEGHKDKQLIAQYYISDLAIQLHKGDLNDAAKSLNAAKSILLEMGHLPRQAAYYKLESTFYEKKKNAVLANQSLNKYYELKDTLNQIYRTQIVENLEVKYETEKKEIEINRLALEDKLNATKLKQQRFTIGGLGLGLALLSFLLYRIFGQNKKIQDQNNIIQSALTEKETLLKEIHHRVKNNLQVISSLLGIQSLSIKDEKAKEAIQEGQSRVHSMSLIHQDLYKKDNLSSIDIKSYLNKLSRDLLTTYSVSEGAIDLETNIDPLHLDVDTVIPIGLIVNELITNTLKYAFPENKNGSIKVDLQERNNQLILQVVDNGIGLEEGQAFNTENSFGHSLIRAFKKKLAAEIQIDGTSGTAVKVIINNYQKE